MDFLARRESRSTTLDRLLAIAPALEAAGEPRMTEEEIAALACAPRRRKTSAGAAARGAQYKGRDGRSEAGRNLGLATKEEATAWFPASVTASA